MSAKACGLICATVEASLRVVESFYPGEVCEAFESLDAVHEGLVVGTY